MEDHVWTITLTRDEGLVLFEYLSRWQQSEDFTIRQAVRRRTLAGANQVLASGRERKSAGLAESAQRPAEPNLVSVA